MKPSHLAAIMLASISGGLLGSPAMQQSGSLPMQTLQLQNSKHAIAPKSTAQVITEAAMRGSRGIEDIAVSWNKKNQRQIRLNRRRANAAGCKNAFAK